MTVIAMSSRNGMTVSAEAGKVGKLKNTHTVNQVLMAEIIFWAVPLVKRCAWEILFSAFNWSKNTENIKVTTGLII